LAKIREAREALEAEAAAAAAAKAEAERAGRVAEGPSPSPWMISRRRWGDGGVTE
jgi:hypothetical protein